MHLKQKMYFYKKHILQVKNIMYLFKNKVKNFIFVKVKKKKAQPILSNDTKQPPLFLTPPKLPYGTLLDLLNAAAVRP